MTRLFTAVLLCSSFAIAITNKDLDLLKKTAASVTTLTNTVKVIKWKVMHIVMQKYSCDEKNCMVCSETSKREIVAAKKIIFSF